MTVLVLVAVMVVIVPTAAGRAMGMLVLAMLVRGMGMARMGMALRMGVSLGVGMAVIVMGVVVMSVVVPVVVVPMIMAASAGGTMRVAMMIMPGMAVVIGAALGLEGSLDGGHGAALPPDHLGEDMVVLDIDGVGGDLGRRVAVADMPGDPHQPQRIVGADFEQALRRRLDQDEATVLKLDGVAVVQRRRLVEIEQDLEPAIALQREPAAGAVLVIQRQRFDDPVLLHRWLADDGGGALHDFHSRDEAAPDRRLACSTTDAPPMQACNRGLGRRLSAART